MTIACKHCDQIVLPDAIDFDQLILHCHGCGKISQLEEADALKMLPQGQHVLPEAERVGLGHPPYEFSVSRDTNRLTIKHKWPRLFGASLLGASLLWNLRLFVVTLSDFGVFNGSWEQTAWWLWVFPAAFVVVGIVSLYVGLCMLVNSTTIRTDRVTLTLSRGPLPWPGRFAIKVSDIEQFYCRESRRLGKHGYHSTYAIHMLTHRQEDRLFFGALVSPEQGVFIETELEHFLDIVDRPIRGEFKPR